MSVDPGFSNPLDAWILSLEPDVMNLRLPNEMFRSPIIIGESNDFPGSSRYFDKKRPLPIPPRTVFRQGRPATQRCSRTKEGALLPGIPYSTIMCFVTRGSSRSRLGDMTLSLSMSEAAEASERDARKYPPQRHGGKPVEWSSLFK